MTSFITQSVKVIAGRQRPDRAACVVGCDDGSDSRESFFSGHASFAATGAGLVCGQSIKRKTWGDGMFQRAVPCAFGIGVAIATAIFPALARTAQDGAAFADILRRGLRLVVFVGLPASAGLILVGRPLAAVIYQGGEFTPDDAARVEFVLFGYASAVWAYSMIHVLTRAFYATGNVRTPVKVAVSMVALNLGLNCTLIWTPLREAGLAWSTAICAVLQVSLLLALVRRRVVPGARLADRAVLRSWGKSIGATAIMIGAVWLIWTFFDRQATTWREALPQLAALVLGGGFIMLLAALTFRMPELGWILAREARRHEGTKGRHRGTRG
ncbi:MAG: polysaccharide biosynthesis C-terminal domain-containing protein [Planctomycetes bacterium]|nr:polysaccharide biosynthesis C-terminal domain-containing protein [Planctomycetota bacterium]